MAESLKEKRFRNFHIADIKNNYIYDSRCPEMLSSISLYRNQGSYLTISIPKMSMCTDVDKLSEAMDYADPLLVISEESFATLADRADLHDRGFDDEFDIFDEDDIEEEDE